jgi:two-component system CitB family response regulator
MTPPIEVLIVEDDPRIAEINCRFTEKVEGFVVVGMAKTGEEAEDWLEVMEPHLLLLDIYLPDMRGTELVRRIRGEGRDTDIIMITAAGETEIVQEAIRGGVIDFIVKPIQMERFLQTLESYRQRRERLKTSGTMTQQEIDRLWSRGTAEFPAGTVEVPKGIDPITLEKVKAVLRSFSSSGMTAGETGKAIGASRSTSRRYLEYLVSVGEAIADVSYGSVGRPERRYILTSAGKRFRDKNKEIFL